MILKRVIPRHSAQWGRKPSEGTQGQVPRGSLFNSAFEREMEAVLSGNLPSKLLSDVWQYPETGRSNDQVRDGTRPNAVMRG